MNPGRAPRPNVRHDELEQQADELANEANEVKAYRKTIVRKNTDT